MCSAWMKEESEEIGSRLLILFVVKKCLIGRYRKGRAMHFSHGGGMRGSAHKLEYGKFWFALFNEW